MIHVALEAEAERLVESAAPIGICNSDHRVQEAAHAGIVCAMASSAGETPSA
jgi:hypothetical protein